MDNKSPDSQAPDILMRIALMPLQIEQSLAQCQRMEYRERRNRLRRRGKDMGDTKRLQALLRKAVANGEIGSSLLLPFGVQVGPIVPSDSRVLASPNKPLRLAFKRSSNAASYSGDGGHGIH